MSTLTDKTVREAMKRVKRELTNASRALDAGDAMGCRNALEAAQHRAFEAKALFHGDELPDLDEAA